MARRTESSYEVLGVRRDASVGEVQASYQRLLIGLDMTRDWQEIRRLQRAFKTLLHPIRRKELDEALDLEPSIEQWTHVPPPAATTSAAAPPLAEPAPPMVPAAVVEFRGLLKGLVASDGAINAREELILEGEARRLGLSMEQAREIRTALFSLASVDAADRRLSCPRCTEAFDAFTAYCPRCALAQTLCANEACGATAHQPDAEACGFCRAPLTRRAEAAAFRGGPHRRAEVRSVAVRGADFEWNVFLEQPIRTAPIVGLGYLYVATAGGRLHALTRAGERVPSLERTSRFPRVLSGGSILATPHYALGVVYVATTGGSLYAIDAWTGEDRHPEILLEGGVVASPLYYAGVLYVATLAGRVEAFDAHTMARLWSFGGDDGPLGRIHASPTLFGELLVVADEAGRVVALKLGPDETDRLAWRLDLGGRILATPLARPRELSLYATDGRLVTVRADGTVLCDINLIRSYVEGSPACWGGGLLVVGAANGGLYAQDPLTGAIDGAYPVRNEHCNVVDAIQSSPVVVGDMVFYGGEAGNLYGVTATDGRMAWSYAIGAPIRGSAVYDDGRLYVGDDRGYFYAFKLRSGDD